MLHDLVRKHEYRKVRKAPVERKPRQAYTAFQLETLEAHFNVHGEAQARMHAHVLGRQIPERCKSR